MLINIQWKGNRYSTNLSAGVDLSIPLSQDTPRVNCFYAPPFHAEPVVSGDFVGSVKKGGPVNFYNIQINPHGNGTHTESVGHVSSDQYSVNRALQEYHYFAELITVLPTNLDNGDRVITEEALSLATTLDTDALIIRTQPNNPEKVIRQYSGTNPIYLDVDAMRWINEKGYQHLLLDLPSVDREEDGGKLTCHKIFWNVFEERDLHKTITELIYVPEAVIDGLYLLNLQMASIELDASPSRPVIYSLEKHT
jgi:kynurenine formamidase